MFKPAPFRLLNMRSSCKTVEEYLATLPEDRRSVLEVVRKVILANLGEGFEEGMQYGMIGYFVPHAVFPAGYHCDPRQPLPYLSLASQKNYMSLYLMCLYMDPSRERRFCEAWANAGKRLDMGKCCIRFKRVDDLALDVLADALRGISAAQHVEAYERAMEQNRDNKAKRAKSASKSGTSKRSTKTASKKVPLKGERKRKVKSSPDTGKKGKNR
ncbi:MAG: DUF1801 domain-containing protein [Planctomycetota bacterium]